MTTETANRVRILGAAAEKNKWCGANSTSVSHCLSNRIVRSSAQANFKMNNTTQANKYSISSPVNTSVKVILMVILNMAAAVGNTLVCCSVYKNRRLQTKTGILILSLAISDLLSALIVAPMSTASIARTNPVNGKAVWISTSTSGPACFIQGAMMYSLTGMSLLTMSFAAVNRYLCVAHSNFYRKYFTLKVIWTSLALMSLSVLVLLICVVAPGFARFTFFGSFALCLLLFGTSHTILKRSIEFSGIIIWGFLPFIIIIVFYSLIYCNVRRHNRRIGARLTQSSMPNNSEQNKTEETADSQEIIKQHEDYLHIKMNARLKENHDKDSSTNESLSVEPTNAHDHTPHCDNAHTRASSGTQDNKTRKQNLIAVKQSINEARITKILLMVFLGFCISWIPAIICHVIHIVSHYQTSRHLTLVVTYSLSLSTAINPFIYGAANRDFRKTYIALLTCKTLT